MVARLWANEIIAYNKTFAQVPERLKEQVREILIAEGHADLITEW